MGYLANLFQGETRTDSGLGRLLSFGRSAAGVAVTPSSALTSTAVYSAIRLLADVGAMLPLITYERRADDGKDRARNHPLYTLLDRASNPEMSDFTFRQVMIGHLYGWGNAYAEIEWTADGYPRALWPLRPDTTSVQRIRGALVYTTYLDDYGSFRLPAWRVLHLKNFGGNGLIGYSPIRLHAETIGLDMGVREYGSRFFGNGARPGIALKHPGILDDDAAARMKQSWIEAHEGLSNAHRVAILEEGVDIETIGIEPEASQFLETRRYQLHDIARIYRVPPHLLQDPTEGGHNSMEQLSLEFVIFTLLPMLRMIEKELMLRLLTDEEAKQIVLEHLLEGLLRGDSATSNTNFATGIQNGYLSRNEVRKLLNMNPVEGGDNFLIPLNMGESGKTKNPTPTKGSGKRNV